MTNKKIVKIVIVAVALFLIFSLAGHWLEIVYLTLGIVPDKFGVLLKGPLHMAPIYGVGALGCLIVGYCVNKWTSSTAIKILVCFVVCTAFCTIAEFTEAVRIVSYYGHNPYWDYSDMTLNLYGFICLQNSLLFGILGTVLALSGIPKLLGTWIMSSE